MRINVRPAIMKTVMVVFLGLSFLSAGGCASPKIVFEKEGTPFHDYKTVYLLTAEKEQDPRELVPVVAEKLRELGLDLKEVKPSEPFEGYQGTGFVVSYQGHILTAEHLLAKEKNATIWLEGNRIEAEVVCSDKDKDLALLKPKSPLPGPVEPLLIGFDDHAKMGQDVYALGYPLARILGSSPRLTKGLVSSTVGLKDNPDQLQVSAEIQPGSSGSPLLDADGKVLGVMTATLNALAVVQRTGGSLPQNVNFAYNAKGIRSFLDTCPGPLSLKKKQTAAASFDTVKSSVARVYSGLLTAEFLASPKLVVGFHYQYIWDLFYRLHKFEIDLHDYDEGSLLLRVGQYWDNPLDTMSGTIDKAFELIKMKFSTPVGQASAKSAESPSH